VKFETVIGQFQR